MTDICFCQREGVCQEREGVVGKVETVAGQEHHQDQQEQGGQQRWFQLTEGCLKSRRHSKNSQLVQVVALDALK